MIPRNIEDPDFWDKQITQLFLVGKMPKEFYDLWFFCKRQCPSHPEGLVFTSVLFSFNFFCLKLIHFYLCILDALLSVGLKLVGPYDVLAGRMNAFDVNDVEKTVLHWRYYYDPPEFQVCVIFFNTFILNKNNNFNFNY